MVERSGTVGRRFEPKRGREVQPIENGFPPSPQQTGAAHPIIEITTNCDLECTPRAGEILLSVDMQKG